MQLDDHGVDRDRLRWALLKTLIKTLNVNLFGAYAFDLSAVYDPGPIMLARSSRRVCTKKDQRRWRRLLSSLVWMM